MWHGRPPQGTGGHGESARASFINYFLPRDGRHIGYRYHWHKLERVFSGRITHATVRALDFLAAHLLPRSNLAKHLRTGQRGEEDTYFYLRRLGYVMVARNFRSPLRRGEIDLIAWDKDVLCFIEVKTRTSHDVKPAETAIDRAKWRQLSATAREYMRPLPTDLQWRFDVVTVYYDRHSSRPQFQLFQNALPS